MSRQKRLKEKASKKVSPKKEKYLKFHREKSATLDLTFPDLSDDARKEIRQDEPRVSSALRQAFSYLRQEEKRREERKPR